MSLPDSSLTALKLCVIPSEPTNSDKYYYDIPLDSVNMGSNTMMLPPTSDVVNCFNEGTLGTYFTVSIESSYDQGLSIVESNNFIFYTNTVTTQITLTNIDTNYGDAPISLAEYTSTNGKRALITYFIGDSSIASISDDGKKIIILKAGSTTIYATHPNFGAYSGAVSNTVSVVVSSIAPTFYFNGDAITTGGEFTIPSQNFEYPPFLPIYPTSNSLGAYIYTSSDRTVATVDAITGVVKIKNTGTTIITVLQAADVNLNYISGSVHASFTVNPIDPTYTFNGDNITSGGQFTIASKNVGDPSFIVVHPTSKSTGAYSYASSDTTIATVHTTTGEHTIKNAGTTTITISQEPDRNYNSGSVYASFTVNPIAPTYTLNGTPITNGGQFTISPQNVGDLPVTPPYPISNSLGAYSYESSDTTVATVNATSGVITIINAGTTNIIITQAAAGNYMSGSVYASFTVNTIPAVFTFNNATITDGRFSIPSKSVGDTSFILQRPTSSSTGAYSHTSSDPNVATIDIATGLIMVKNAGTTIITVSQEADGKYKSGSVYATFVVKPIAQTFYNSNGTAITNGLFTIPSQNVGDPSFRPVYPYSNSLGAYSYESSDMTVATVDTATGVITIINAGTTIITESQVADGNYKSGSVHASFVVDPIDSTFYNSNGDTITNGVFTIPSQSVGDPYFTPTTYPTSNSTGAYSYESSDKNVATVHLTTGVITIKNAGTTTITESQVADRNYKSGSVHASFTVNPIDSTFTGAGIMNGLFTIAPKNVGDLPFTPTYPKSNSMGAYSYTSSHTNIATVDAASGLVTIKIAGTTTITESQVAYGNYKAGSVQGSFTVNPIDPTYILNGTPITNGGQFTISPQNVGDLPVTLQRPTSSSTGAYSHTSSDTNVATIDIATGVITIVGAGTTTITVSQEPDEKYKLGSVHASFTVNPIDATFSLNGTPIMNGQFTIPSKNFGDQQPFAPTYPKSNSLGAYSYASSHTNIATVDAASGLVTVKNAGTTIITELQAAYGNYKFGSVQGSFTVNPIDPTYTLNGNTITNGGLFSIPPKSVGDTSFTLPRPTSSSTGAYSYESSDLSVATIDAASGLIIVKNAGTTNIIIKQVATENYKAGSVYTTFVVNPIDAFFTFNGIRITDGLFSIPSKSVGDLPFTPTYPISSNTETACIYESSNTNFATVNATTGLITIKNAGTTTITIKQVAAGNYKFISVQASFTVNTIPAVFTFNGTPITDGRFTILSKSVGDSKFTPNVPTSSSMGAYSYASSDTTVATVHLTTGEHTPLRAGTTIITVTQAAYGNYMSGSVQAIFVVNPIAPTYTLNGTPITNNQFTITSQILGDLPVTPTYPSSNSIGAYSYTSSDTTVATVNATSGAITLKNAGTTNIIITQAAAGNYMSGSVRASLVVMYKWSKQGQDIDGEASGDKSGYNVSISADGSLVAIGAPYNNNTNGSDAGHVRVYKLIGDIWTKQDGDIDGSSASDQSGYSVSISGDGSMVAVGAPNDDGNGTNCGHVRVFKLIGGVWVKQGQDIDGDKASDESGTSVSLSYNGSIVAIGSPFSNGNGKGTKTGQVRVFKLVSGTWIQQGLDIDGDNANDESGTSVSLSHDGLTVAIGAPNNDSSGTNAGQVRVFKFASGAWTKQGGNINGEATNDESGTSVSLSSDGSMVAIGAPNNDNTNGTNAGQVRVYKLIGSTWTKQGQDIDGEAASDMSGTSVSISADGLIVAIGAPNNNGNGTDAGQVRVYKLISGVWVKQDGDIDGEAANDLSGYSVSLSANGLTVVIGAYDNDGNGTGSGQVRVYKYTLYT